MANPEARGYELSASPIFENADVTRYATQDPSIFIEFFDGLESDSEFPEAPMERYLEDYDGLRTKLFERSMGDFIPEIVSSDAEDSWVALGVPEGLYTLSQVHRSYPDGLDGRDWAWMMRRALIVFEALGRGPVIDAQSFLIHPEEHGIVLLGWHPGSEDPNQPMSEILSLMESYLALTPDGAKQIEFIGKVAEAMAPDPGNGSAGSAREPMGYKSALKEYELKLNQLYGARKFRPFEVDSGLSTAFLQGKIRS